MKDAEKLGILRIRTDADFETLMFSVSVDGGKFYVDFLRRYHPERFN